MSYVGSQPYVAGMLVTPVKKQAASTPAASTPAASTPPALATETDSFTPHNMLFAGYVQPALNQKARILDGGTEPDQPVTGIPAATPAATPAASPEAKKAVDILLKDGHFGIIASSYDGNDTLTKDEASKWLDSLKNSKDTTRGPFTGQAREDMINALTYVTDGDHFAELAGNDGDNTTISEMDLKTVASSTENQPGKPGGITGGTPGATPSGKLTDGQQKVKDALGTLYYVTNGADIGVDSAVRNAVIRGGPADGEVGFTKQGVNNLALAKLDDENIWQDVPQDKRQKVQDAAKVLMNTDEKNPDAAKVFSAALAKNGDINHMSLDEVKGYIEKPETLPTGDFDYAFPILSRYPNIHIDKKSFSPAELEALNDTFTFQANDPDGKLLLENLNKNHPNGYTIKKDPEAASRSNAIASNSGDTLIIGGSFNPNDKAGVMHVLTHEITHGATGAPKGTGEAMANVLAARLTYRYGGNKTTRETNYGHTTQFDGSAAAEAEVYKYTLLDTYKKDGAWPKAGYSYEGTPDFSYGDYLKSLGFNFDFPFVIDLGPK